MELDILDGRNIKSSYRDRVGVRQDKSVLHRMHRMKWFNAPVRKNGARLIRKEMGVHKCCPLAGQNRNLPNQTVKTKLVKDDMHDKQGLQVGRLGDPLGERTLQMGTISTEKVYL